MRVDHPIDRLAILLVSGGGKSCAPLTLAFRRAAPNVHLAIVQCPAEGNAYLSGVREYADRASYPMPQIILLDVDVELQAGLEYLGWLRENPRSNHIPTMILTGVNDPNVIDWAYALGANSCLLKSGDEKIAYDLAKGISAYAALVANIAESHPAEAIRKIM